MANRRNGRGSTVDGKTLRLPDAAAKTGARPVALSSVVLALLADAPRRSRFIIPTTRAKRRWPRGAQSTLGKPSVRPPRSRICISMIYDTAFATRGAGLGASAVLLRDALGHKSLQMTNGYLSRQPVHELAQRIGSPNRSPSL